MQESTYALEARGYAKKLEGDLLFLVREQKKRGSGVEGMARRARGERSPTLLQNQRNDAYLLRMELDVRHSPIPDTPIPCQVYCDENGHAKHGSKRKIFVP